MRIPLIEIREVARMAREYAENYPEELWPDCEPQEYDTLIEGALADISTVERFADQQVEWRIKNALSAEEES